MTTSAPRPRELCQQPDRPPVDSARARARRRRPGSPKLPPEVPGLCRGARADNRTLLSNLPVQLPLLADEADLVRIYFGDLISAALKDNP